MKIIAGLTAKQTFTLSGYSASDDWVLTGKLADTSTTHELASGLFSGSGTEWTLTIPDTTTTGYTAGDYTLYLVATLDGDSEVAAQLPSSVVTLGTVSHNQIMVTALTALMEGKSTKDYTSLAVDGESITRLTPEEATKWLAFYEKRLSAEKRAAHGASGITTVKMGFSA